MSVWSTSSVGLGLDLGVNQTKNKYCTSRTNLFNRLHDKKVISQKNFKSNLLNCFKYNSRYFNFYFIVSPEVNYLQE